MIARVESLHLYPVKGLRAQDRITADVALTGLAGDRRWMITDPDGGFLTQRTLPRLAQLDAEPTAGGIVLSHGGEACPVARPSPGAARLDVTIWGSVVTAAVADAVAADWLGTVLGRPCRLVYMDDERARPVEATFGEPGDHVGFADEYPLLATSHASLAVLNGALKAPVPMDRFRPNLTISGLAPWSEDRWKRVRIGRMVFRAPKTCTRCIVITHDQRSGDRPVPGEPLRTLGRLNRNADGIVFGINLIPEATGSLSVGDDVEVLEAT
jgi:uncharacterized protein YcbX